MRIFIVTIMSLSLSACAFGNNFRYNNITANIPANQGTTIAVATLDKRPYVVDQDSDPSHVAAANNETAMRRRERHARKKRRLSHGSLLFALAPRASALDNHLGGNDLLRIQSNDIPTDAGHAIDRRLDRTASDSVAHVARLDEKLHLPIVETEL